MPALSFQEEWIDKLLSGAKQQTTRPQTDRIKVGDICNIYNQQRRRIADKPLRQLTREGCDMVFSRGGTYPKFGAHHWAHFLGKVKITEVYDLCLPHHSHRSEWAKAGGFMNFGCADSWFAKRYGEEWYQKTWTVIRWNGWLERYFEPRV